MSFKEILECRNSYINKKKVNFGYNDAIIPFTYTKYFLQILHFDNILYALVIRSEQFL